MGQLGIFFLIWVRCMPGILQHKTRVGNFTDCQYMYLQIQYDENPKDSGTYLEAKRILMSTKKSFLHNCGHIRLIKNEWQGNLAASL